MRYLPIPMLLGCSLGLDATYLDPQKGDTATEDDDVLQVGEDNTNTNTQELCSDGLDNDGDALIDCLDPDCGNAPECLVDNDNDGFFATNDCDDNNPFINPGATEIANDGIDQDCSGEDYTTNTGGNTVSESICNDFADNDNDGLTDCDDPDCATSAPCTETSSSDVDGDGWDASIDCNDYDSNTYPGAYDTPGDSIDQDCDGADAVGSTASEDCFDNTDNDGDGLIDCDDSDCMNFSHCTTDSDNDGYDASVDCNDYDASINPGAYDWYGDGIDQDCDGSDYGSSSSSSESVCFDGVDNDGDGLIDCDDSDCMYTSYCYTSYSDYDGDGYDFTLDCNDYDANIYPGAYDTPGDSIDQDCDGVDAGSSSGSSCTPDGSIFGTGSVFYSSQPASNNSVDAACSFYDTSEYLLSWTPGQTGCATLDTSSMTEDSVLSVYTDCPSNGGTELECDDDGGSGNTSLLSLDVTSGNNYLIAIEGYSSDPSSGSLNLSIDTVYDCDGNALSSSGVSDNDGDGYDVSVDCNDYDSSVYPGAYDTPGDGIDQNCDGMDATTSNYEFFCSDGLDDDIDGLIDCDDPDCMFSSDCYTSSYDYDGDGYEVTIDCDDYNSSIYPGAYDIPGDGIDQDCDGQDSTSSSSCAVDGTIYFTGSNAFTSGAAPTNNQIDGSCVSSNPSDYLVSWTPTQSGCATIDSSTMSADTVLSVYTDCPSQGGIELSCDDDSGAGTASEISLDVTAGSTYLIGLEGYYSDLSNAVIDVELDSSSSCSGSSVTPNTCNIDSYLSIGTNALYTSASSNQVDQSCGSSSNNNEYLFEWTPSSTGCARFATETMTIDTVLSLHLGCPVLGGYEVACDDDGGISTTSVIEYDVYAGTTYYLQLEGYSTNLSTATVTVELDTSGICGSGGGWDTGWYYP